MLQLVLYKVIESFLKLIMIIKTDTINVKLMRHFQSIANHQNIMIGSSTIEFMHLPGWYNAGVESCNTVQLLSKIHYSDFTRTKRVLLYIGVNDISHGIPCQKIASNILRIVNVFPKQTHVIYIPIIISEYQRKFGHNRLLLINTLNKYVAQQLSSKQNVRIVDMPHFSETDFSWDGLHLNENGYKKLIFRLNI